MSINFIFFNRELQMDVDSSTSFEEINSFVKKNGITSYELLVGDKTFDEDYPIENGMIIKIVFKCEDELCLFSKNKHDALKHAAKMRHIPCLEKAVKERAAYYNYRDNCAISYAIQENDAELLKFLHRSGCDIEGDGKNWAHLSSDKSIDCAEYLLDNGCHISSDFYTLLEKNDYELMIFLHQRGVEFHDSSMSRFAFFGIDFVRYGHENGAKKTLQACANAAAVGDLESLTYLHENGYKWNANTFAEAAKGGNIDCLKYMKDNGCSYNSDAANVVAEKGDLETLKYLESIECKIDSNTINFASKAITYINHDRRLECIQYIHSLGVEFSDDVCTNIIRHDSDNVKNIRLLLSMGAKCDSKTIAEAAKLTNPSLLKFLHRRGCPWDSKTTAAAAKFGKLDNLKYAHKNGCEIKLDSYTNIAIYGFSYGADCDSVLDYLEEVDCPWHPGVYIFAASCGNLDIIKKFHEKGYEFEEEYLEDAIKYGLYHVMSVSLEEYSHLIDYKMIFLAGECRQKECLDYFKDYML